MNKVVFKKLALKQLDKAPQHVQVKMTEWVRLVTQYGLPEARKVPSYHDEPLKGKLKGLRSIRLSLQWRAFYTENAESEITLITVEAVNPHDYKS